MLIYLADLIHNYYPGRYVVPLNIAYLAAYAKQRFGSDVEIILFKYCEDILAAIDRRQPSLVGFSNYPWNESMTKFVGEYVKRTNPGIPIVMGGPNIRSDRDGIGEFLRAHDFVDVYITFEGEVPFAALVETMLDRATKGYVSGEDIRQFDIESCFSLDCGVVKGGHGFKDDTNLDYIPSPYTSGILDAFLTPDFIPLFETNRGCPYTCSYCSWGASARKRVKQFSLERVLSDMQYVAGRGTTFYKWMLADANFGILSRDVEIAQAIRILYDTCKPFHSITIWWAKNAQEHMVKIAKTLHGLSNAYIAFQTFDPNVEKLIKRKNISSERLLQISNALSASSERFHTDILLGLPGETRESHVSSLNRAYDLGFNSIGAGEVNLLKGSDLETDESRDEFGLKTKYRLIQDGFGVYRGNFIAEFEEGVRSTRWITEEEMLSLRVLRAVFYGAVTLGELDPMARYLRTKKIRLLPIFQRIIDDRNVNPCVAESIEWLIEQAHCEWHETREAALEFYSQTENRQQLLTNPVTKLNFDFWSYIFLSRERYEALHSHIHKTLRHNLSSTDTDVVDELLELCKARNFVTRCLHGCGESGITLPVSPRMLQCLFNINYTDACMNARGNPTLCLSIDESIAGAIRKRLAVADPKIQTVSLVCQRYNTYMQPTGIAAATGIDQSAESKTPCECAILE